MTWYLVKHGDDFAPFIILEPKGKRNFNFVIPRQMGVCREYPWGKGKRKGKTVPVLN